MGTQPVCRRYCRRYCHRYCHRTVFPVFRKYVFDELIYLYCLINAEKQGRAILVWGYFSGKPEK
jgi:hypothetical protein